ncbi:MAG TPA: RHS repeat-associated core domain-containing protein, partial [Chitinophagaceae bacterium]|nr:RHS repeat-associated core domain-containing protein [Chitinophagaceae bacterium]
DFSDCPFITQIPHQNNVNAVRNYTELFDYDDLGNIKQIKHTAANANWTQSFRYEYEDDSSNNTNRLKSTSLPGDPANGPFTATYQHDANGNITSMPHLSAPNSLIWNYANQLTEINLGGGGKAYYVYGAGGNRVRKIIERQGGKKTERIYLGMLEIYREYQNNTKNFERNTLHIADNSGRIAQVDTKLFDPGNTDPSNLLNADLIRYQYGNHLGSATLETDKDGVVISYEEYHPFGTSAYRSNKNNTDISLKRYRFSGKEKDDETGFYYFGARYYAPWIARWISCDPAGFVRGFNLFRYCSNNPVCYFDPDGMQDRGVQWIVPRDVDTETEFQTWATAQGITYSGTPTYNSTTHVWSVDSWSRGAPGSGGPSTPRQTPATGASALSQTGQNAITQNPEGFTLEVPNDFDQQKIDAMRERVLDPADRQVGHRSADSTGSRTDDIRARDLPAHRRAIRDYNRTAPSNQRINRPNNMAMDHTVELQYVIRQPNPADERLRPQDRRPQNASTNSSQGRTGRNVADDQIARGAPEDVPAGGVARSNEMGLWRNSPRVRALGRAAGFGLMAAGPVLNIYGASQVENDAVRYSGYGLGGAEAVGVGTYAVGRWGLGGASGAARGLSVMRAGAGIARFAGGGATVVLSTYALVNDIQNENYGVVLGDAAGIVAGGAMLAGSGPVAAVAGGIAITNAAGDWVESNVTEATGSRTAGVAAGTATGAALGAGIGAAVGVWFFGVGAAPGAAVGAVVGGIAGFVGSFW